MTLLVIFQTSSERRKRWGFNQVWFCTVSSHGYRSLCCFLEILDRYRPKGVFGKGVGNSKNASEMRQKCVKNASEMRQNGSSFIGKRGTSKMRHKCVKIASKMRQKCAEHLWWRTPFGRYRLEFIVFKKGVLKSSLNLVVLVVSSVQMTPTRFKPPFQHSDVKAN